MKYVMLLFFLTSCISTQVIRLNKNERLIKVCDTTIWNKYHVYIHARRQKEIMNCDQIKFLEIGKQCSVIKCYNGL